MKAGTAQKLTVISLIAFLFVALPTAVLAKEPGSTLSNQDNANHITLAKYYKEQAEEYQDMIAEEIEAVKNKPRTSRFGRNAKTFKQHVEFKLRQFQVAVEENLNKAAYHEKMAAEQSFQPVASSTNRSGNTGS